MTIVEMRDRLTNIIEENEKRGWGERNESDMVIRNKVSKRVTEYHKIKHVSGSWLGLHMGWGLGLTGEMDNCFEITIDEPIARYGGRG